jgi:hypothetical protein
MMNTKEINKARSDSAAETEPQPVLRPWIMPTFERVRLEEALSTGKGTGSDGAFLYS